jgi:hypothetical protein
MLLRIGSTLTAMVMFAVIGTGLVFWGTKFIPSMPLRVGFFVLVALVFLVALRTIARDPQVWRKAETRARPASVDEQTLVTVPYESPLGMCWQCGMPVRASNTVCLKCGATQTQKLKALPPIIPGKVTAWDSGGTIYSVPEREFTPMDSAPVYRVVAPEGWSNSLEAGDAEQQTTLSLRRDSFQPQNSAPGEYEPRAADGELW